MRKIVCFWDAAEKRWMAKVDTGLGKPLVYELKWKEPGNEGKVLKAMERYWKGYAVSIRREVKHHPSLGG